MFAGSRTHAVFLRSVAIDIMFDLINNRLITEEQQWDTQAN
ncbi:hypothetical protein VN1027_13360 [Helicobacter pylori]|nr:hypothetical protein VN1027_13360 [Helicobacter pylori]